MRLIVMGLGGPPGALATALLLLVGAWMFNELFQPFEGRFGLPRIERPEHTVAEVHGRVMKAPQSLQGGPAPEDAQLLRFHARLAESPLSDWADTYCRDFESNPAVLVRVSERLEPVLAIARQAGLEGAMRVHGEKAAAASPERHHAEWETAAVLAAWALVLREHLEAGDFDLLYGPFTAVLPVPVPTRM